MNRNILIFNASLVHEGQEFNGSILVSGQTIREVFTQPPPQSLIDQTQCIDATGLLCIPGVIDEHVHFREPGLTHKADIETESAAAVAGGVTSFMDMPNTMPQTTSIREWEAKNNLASKRSFANYSFYLGATNDNIEQLTAADPNVVCGIKVFMGASTGNMLVNNPNSLEQIFGIKNIIIGTHNEEESVIRHQLELFKGKYGLNIPCSSHPEIRNEDACFLSSKKAVDLAMKHNTRLHLLHLSTAKELSLLKPGMIQDKHITGEVCIHHLPFDSDDYPSKGCLIKWNPSIKNPSDREALISGIHSGLLDTIATDHAPHLLDEKNHPYLDCPSGGPMIQHSLLVMLEMWKNNTLPLPLIVEKMCHAPARLYQIKKRGFLKAGYYADLVLIDPARSLKVDRESLLYKCKWSPLEGMNFSCSVSRTMVNGNWAFANGKASNEKAGMMLEFSR